MTLTRLPHIGEAQHWYYCHKCITATDHYPDGRCKTCGEKTVHIPREGENAKHPHG